MRLLAHLLFLLATLTLVACADPRRPARAPTLSPRPIAGRLPPGVRPLHYRLNLRIDPKTPHYEGDVDIVVSLDQPRDVIWLNGRSLALHRPVLYRTGAAPLPGLVVDAGGSGFFAVKWPEPVGPGEFTLSLRFYGTADGRCAGLYRYQHKNDWYLFSQLEATYARDVFPGFDEPSYKTPFDISITTPAGNVAISNAREVSRGPLGTQEKTVFATTPPLPTYLLAFAVGPFDVVEAPPVAPNAQRSRPLPFRGVAWRGAGEKLRWSLAQAPPLLADLEGYLASEYPFDKLDFIATPCAQPAAMENPGAVTFYEDLLLVDPGHPHEATQRAAAGTIAHELAHMWFGNLVTPHWWEDIWLNESFASWLGSATIGRQRPGDHAELATVVEAREAMSLDDRAATQAIRHEMASEREISSAFDGLTYDKGAAVLGMVERQAGPDAFQRGLRAYLARHRGANATADDLLRALEREAGADASATLRSFLTQPGVPLIDARLDCQGPTPALRLRQSRYLPLGRQGKAERPWQVPVCARYPDAGTTRESCTLLRNAEGVLALPAARCPAWVMPNADGAGYYRWQLPAGDLHRLARALPTLNARERVSFVDVVQAAWASAALGPSDAFELLAPLASDPQPAIASAPMPLLTQAHDWLGHDGPLRHALERYAANLYAAPFAALGPQPTPGETPERTLAREQVLEFLALTARAPQVRASLTEPARQHLLTRKKEPQPSGLALRLAVNDGDAQLFDLALERLAGVTYNQRWRYLHALATTTQPALIARVRALVFDRRLYVEETYQVLYDMLENSERREETWAWVTANQRAIRARLDDKNRRWLPHLAGNLCEARHADELGALFADLADHPDVAPRIEASAERIRACSAQRVAQLEPLRAFLKRPPPTQPMP
ncbi:MAG: M1 family metallopeptidase [Polyangiaceae bacterium]|nr:M1 family metallopeptidase [Polyangiaceae bacterium]